MALSAEPVTILRNVIGGKPVESTSERKMQVTNPSTGEIIADVPLSTATDLNHAVQAALKAQESWGRRPLKERVQVMFRLKTLMEKQTDELAEVIHRENGKSLDEAKASVGRGIECIEYATSLPQLAPGQVLEVSRGVECKLLRYPLGIVAGITPFNFPLMIPLWMVPIALSLGNAFILKPSEQTPLAAQHLAELLHEARLPDGVFSVVNGDREIVEAICDHPQVKAIGFVGSTKVARAVYERGTRTGKRVRALGGAKNHLIVLPDADPEMTAANVVASATGCAGQRCMAASVMIAVGDVQHIVDDICKRMESLLGARDFGPVISALSRERISAYADRANRTGAKLQVDGRKRVADDAHAEGFYMGPVVIDHAAPDHEAACEEIFGPVLTIIRVKTLEEALAIENANPYGNAAAIYTSSGHAAQVFTERASAGMIGVNIGLPVPREPFPFGGWNASAFGEGDLTGESAIDFWSKTKKVTTKWSGEHRGNWKS